MIFLGAIRFCDEIAMNDIKFLVHLLESLILCFYDEDLRLMHFDSIAKLKFWPLKRWLKSSTEASKNMPGKTDRMLKMLEILIIMHVTRSHCANVDSHRSNDLLIAICGAKKCNAGAGARYITHVEKSKSISIKCSARMQMLQNIRYELKCVKCNCGAVMQ